MVRPRFAKLPEAQQQTILRVALDEFATHGFHDASLNRMIEAAGISKGSMYYYFDGKDDLYAFAARTELAGLFEQAGPLPPLDAGDADAFWAVLEDYYLRLLRALAASPKLAALLRGWSTATKSPGFQSVEGELEQESLPWMQQALTAGQRVGAVRDDLPGLVAALFSMIRGAVGP
jgi:AcrR family transcriptional regulator